MDKFKGTGFTGATQNRKGKFELADGGTIFLDEIGDMSPRIQAKILRVLQEREFEQVGGSRTIKVDVRVIAATNKNLEAEMKAGNFREDLYYRLAGFTVTVPPLRERKEDIPLLALHFLNMFAAEMSREKATLSHEAMKALEAYHLQRLAYFLLIYKGEGNLTHHKEGGEVYMSRSPFGPNGPKPGGGPLSPGSTFDQLLRPDLGIGEESTVWNKAYPHDDHTDAILYKKAPDGRIYPIEKHYLK